VSVHTVEAAIRLRRHHVWMAAAPLSAAQFCATLNERIGIGLLEGGTNSLINLHNANVPVRRDASGRVHPMPGREGHPITGVTYLGARLVAEAMGGRLPTIAEWEDAAGADLGWVYPWGNEPPSASLANYGELVGATTVPGTYPPNQFGFWDLAGNVSEWCVRSHSDSFDVPRVPGLGLALGGAWNKYTGALATRHVRLHWQRMGAVSIGVRVVFDAPPDAQ